MPGQALFPRCGAPGLGRPAHIRHTSRRSADQSRGGPAVAEGRNRRRVTRTPSPSGHGSLLPDSLPPPCFGMPRADERCDGVGQGATKELRVQRGDDLAEPCPGRGRQSPECYFEDVPRLCRIAAGAVVQRQIEISAALVEELLVLVQGLGDSTTPEVLGFEPIDGGQGSLRNARNLAGRGSITACWPSLSTDGAGRLTRHRPFGSASCGTSCQAPVPSSAVRQGAAPSVLSAASFLLRPAEVSPVPSSTGLLGFR